MRMISLFMIAAICFYAFMASGFVLLDIIKRGRRNWFAFVRFSVLLFTGVWFAMVEMGYVTIMIEPISIMGRVCILFLISVVFYDRYHIN